MSLGTLLLIVTFKLRISLVFMRAPCDLSVFTRDSFLRCQRFYCSTIYLTSRVSTLNGILGHRMLETYL